MHKVLKCSSAGFISCPRCSDPAASLVLFLDMSEAYTIYFYSWPEVAQWLTTLFAILRAVQLLHMFVVQPGV